MLDIKEQLFNVFVLRWMKAKPGSDDEKVAFVEVMNSLKYFEDYAAFCSVPSLAGKMIPKIILDKMLSLANGLNEYYVVCLWSYHWRDIEDSSYKIMEDMEGASFEAWYNICSASGTESKIFKLALKKMQAQIRIPEHCILFSVCIHPKDILFQFTLDCLRQASNEGMSWEYVLTHEFVSKSLKDFVQKELTK